MIIRDKTADFSIIWNQYVYVHIEFEQVYSDIRNIASLESLKTYALLKKEFILMRRNKLETDFTKRSTYTYVIRVCLS